MRFWRVGLTIAAALCLMTGLATAAIFNFAWDDALNDPDDIRGYRLERSIDNQATWAQVAEVPARARIATDTITAPGVVCWRVLAFTSQITSGPSNIVCLTFPHAPVNVTVTVTLSGTVQ